ncbi:MAG: hypothetical protein NUV70_07480 [Caldiserica bacterium]|nr:hypothetical protein [Caldisericota bacterium]
MPEYGVLIFAGAVILLIGLAIVLPLAWKGWNRWSSWLALLVGLGIYFLVPLAQPPLQDWALGSLPQDVSFFIRTITLALIAGILQELVKFLFLGGFKLLSSSNILWIGAMLGLGFGLGEGFYILYSIRNLTYSMPSFVFFLDRAGAILLHIDLAFFLAYGFKRRLIAAALPLVIILHSAFVYLGLLHVDKKISVAASVGIGLAASFILYLVALYYYFKDLRGPLEIKKGTV